MSDDIQFITPDEGEASPQNEMNALKATLGELEATASGDDLTKQAIESTKARIAELRQDNPSLH